MSGTDLFWTCVVGVVILCSLLWMGAEYSDCEDAGGVLVEGFLTFECVEPQEKPSNG